MDLEVLDEVSYEIGPGDAEPVFVHDFGLKSQRPPPDVEAIKKLTEEALLRVARREIENDGFNRLTPLAALAPDDVVVIRAYAKYLKQAGFTYSQAYVEQTLAAHPAITGKLVALFHARFDPALGEHRDELQKKLDDEVKEQLNAVPVADEDRILRRFLYLVRATLRTNNWVKDGIECYKNFLRGLLDVTDNLAGGKVVPPKDVVRHDADDPYLVVAADKGTATFSDIANGVSAEYGFWLGDAFASGGSAGYDHKKMGITAKGAWESVKRHFREMGVDTQSQDFTVGGNGDMSGDVFGNGMLLSRHIRLLAAFDHRHVFLDPAPDVEASFRERERMFALPRSSWDDYDRKLISAGGGVWARSEKSVPISPQVRAALA